MRANPFTRLKMLIFFILNYEHDASDLRSAQWIILSGGNSVEKEKSLEYRIQKENEGLYIYIYKTHPIKRKSYGSSIICLQHYNS